MSPMTRKARGGSDGNVQNSASPPTTYYAQARPRPGLIVHRGHAK